MTTTDVANMPPGRNLTNKQQALLKAIWPAQTDSHPLILCKPDVLKAMNFDGGTALLCDRLCYKIVHKWMILVRD